MLNVVSVECIRGKVFFGREQTKVLGGNNPAQRAEFATNGAIAGHDLLKIAFNFERNLPTVAATFVFHRITPPREMSLSE